MSEWANRLTTVLRRPLQKDWVRPGNMVTRDLEARLNPGTTLDDPGPGSSEFVDATLLVSDLAASELITSPTAAIQPTQDRPSQAA